MAATGVEIKLDKPRVLKFSVNALALFEEKSGGRGVQESMKDMQKRGLLFRDLRLMTWAALRHEQPDLTVEAAGDIMECNPGSLADLAEALSEAVVRALGTEEQVGKLIKERGLHADITGAGEQIKPEGEKSPE